MSTDRRRFLKQAGAAIAGGLILPAISKASGLFGNMAASWPIGIQLFTVFKPMNEDPEGTLKKIAAIGYQEVESAFSTRGGYYGYKPKEFKKLVEGVGLKWRAHHALGAPFKMPPPDKMPKGADGKPIEIPKMPALLTLRDNYQQLVDDAAEAELSYLVCASTPVANLEEIKNSIEVFQKTGEAAKKAGIGFAYHNHATEFDAVEGGKTPYELVLSQTDKDLVKMELDLAWATKAGKDPVALFKEHPGRFPLWHAKDIKSDLQTITEVGNGVVEFKRIFEAAKIAGLQYFFIEQDMAPAMENVATGYKNLAKILG
ncbi:sugar phosphate isomerase/epimerase family protein [Dyadobacter pollutisoli]|jgi:sugar phosphate isomerase/epimerase|uniref:Sugar phosphate isomerase/epimerase n=1 Tax=Dyadobacter pollutisoli TaxID=2910158 RepID=A0A9E8NF78_9BACT|nr:sugar phosphate isomerase/epimerase [Dyadobacter pollutisoli]WAC13029.1 sugar phosphate isomerase/epimerase [Dyadobacter pollutisoli]